MTKNSTQFSSTQFSLTHPEHGKMVFVPQGDFTKSRDWKHENSVIVRIMYYDGATHKSLTDGQITSEDAKTGIKRARRIWDEKVQEGWTTI